MDQQSVDTDGRWVVVDSVFKEILMDEDKNSSIEISVVKEMQRQNARHYPRVPSIHFKQPTILWNRPRHKCYCRFEENFGAIVAGHDSALAVADQIAKTEVFRSLDTLQTSAEVFNSTVKKSYAQKRW